MRAPHFQARQVSSFSVPFPVTGTDLVLPASTPTPTPTPSTPTPSTPTPTPSTPSSTPAPTPSTPSSTPAKTPSATPERSSSSSSSHFHPKTVTTTRDSSTVTSTTTETPTWTSTVASTSTTAVARSGSKVSQNALVGGIVGGVAVLVLLAVVLGFVWHRRNRRKNRDLNELERQGPPQSTGSGVAFVNSGPEINIDPAEPDPNEPEKNTEVLARFNSRRLYPDEKAGYLNSGKRLHKASSTRSTAQDSATVPYHLRLFRHRSDITSSTLPRPTSQDTNLHPQPPAPERLSAIGMAVTSDEIDRNNFYIGPMNDASTSQVIDETFRNSSVYLEETPPVYTSPTAVTSYFVPGRYGRPSRAPPAVQVHNPPRVDPRFHNRSTLATPSPPSSPASSTHSMSTPYPIPVPTTNRSHKPIPEETTVERPETAATDTTKEKPPGRRWDRRRFSKGSIPKENRKSGHSKSRSRSRHALWTAWFDSDGEEGEGDDAPIPRPRNS